MSQYIQSKAAVEIIKTAFSPLQCLSECWDNGYRIRFTILDDNSKPLIKVDDIHGSQYSKIRRLRGIIESVRSRLKDQGYTLDSWRLSDQYTLGSDNKY